MAIQSNVLIQPGLKIHCNGSDGTLGLIVNQKKYVDRGRGLGPRYLSQVNRSRVYLVSCYHVLDNGHETGKVTLPDHGDLEIATYTRDVTRGNAEYDIAIAQIKQEFVDGLRLSNTVLNSNETLDKVVQARPRKTLCKVGASTDTTECQIERILSKYGNVKKGLKLAPVARASSSIAQEYAEFSKQGDSGAVWFLSGEGRAVGLNARGGFDQNRGAATQLYWAMKAIGLVLYRPQQQSVATPASAAEAALETAEERR